MSGARGLEFFPRPQGRNGIEDGRQRDVLIIDGARPGYGDLQLPGDARGQMLSLL